MADNQVFVAVVNRGKANALLRKAQENGATGGTIFLGEGTMPSRFLDKLGINQTQKEVLFAAVPMETHKLLLGVLRHEFKMHKRYKGIAFSMPFRRWQPDARQLDGAIDVPEQPPYICLMTVLEKGQWEDCMRIARAAGAQGGTVIHGRGAGVQKHEFYVPLTIEPQKDIVMIVTRRETAYAIRAAIYDLMELAKPGKGIIFSLPVLSTIGLYEERKQEARP